MQIEFAQIRQKTQFPISSSAEVRPCLNNSRARGQYDTKMMKIMQFAIVTKNCLNFAIESF